MDDMYLVRYLTLIVAGISWYCNVGRVTEGTTLLLITQISSGCIHPGSAKYN